MVERMTRAERKAATRTALVDAGERLVRKRGFAVSVEEIAAEAGFTKGAVYSNFAGRRELLEEISSRVIPGFEIVPDHTLPSLQSAMQDLAGQLTESLESDPEQVILQLDAMVQMLRDTDLRDAIVRDGSSGADEAWRAALPWPLPLPVEHYCVALNAVAVGLATHRLMLGRDAVPDELFVWVLQRLAADLDDHAIGRG